MSTAYTALNANQTRTAFDGRKVAVTVDVPGFPCGVSVHCLTAGLFAQVGIPTDGTHQIATVLESLRGVTIRQMAVELRTYLLNAKMRGATHVRVG